MLELWEDCGAFKFKAKNLTSLLGKNQLDKKCLPVDTSKLVHLEKLVTYQWVNKCSNRLAFRNDLA